MAENDELVRLKTAVRLAIEPVLLLIEDDPHQFGTRPCSTCRAITAIAGRNFGCVKKQGEASR